jgi:hypothetical protein
VTLLNRLAITVVEIALFVAGVAIWRHGRGRREEREHVEWAAVDTGPNS